MPGKIICAVGQCSCQNSKKKAPFYTNTFKIPDKENLRKRWVKFIKSTRHDFLDKYIKYARVCRHHFEPDQISQRLDLGMGYKRMTHLVPGAVPSIRKCVNCQIQSKPKEERSLAKKKRKNEVSYHLLPRIMLSILVLLFLFDNNFIY